MKEEFEHGELVEVRQFDNDEWGERTYVGTMPNCKGHWCMGYLQNEKSFDGVPFRWRQIRKIQKPEPVLLSISNEKEGGAYRFIFERGDKSPKLIADIKTTPEHLFELFVRYGLQFSE